MGQTTDNRHVDRQKDADGDRYGIGLGLGKHLPTQAIDRVKREMLGQKEREPAKHQHDVGYKNPPQHSRFTKGQSGNPNGRPPKSNVAERSSEHQSLDLSPSAKALLKQGARKVKVREGEVVSEITVREALDRAQITSAMKGNAMAQKCLLDRFAVAEKAEAAAIEHSNDAWLSHQQSCRDAIVKARSRGEPEPECLPHPDDLVFEHGKLVRITGPVCAWTLSHTQETIQIRDALLLQDALDMRMRPVNSDDNPRGQTTTAAVAALIMNDALPKRLQLDDTQLVMCMGKYECMPMRQLLKQVFAAWRALGKKVPRGQTLPPVGCLMDAWDEAVPIIRQIRKDQQAA